jgi:hypothetical protein
MEKKVSIERERIILKNQQCIYFLKNKKVFRGNRKPVRGANKFTDMANYVVESSIKEIKEIDKSNYRTADILKKYGVKVIHRRRNHGFNTKLN